MLIHSFDLFPRIQIGCFV